MLARAMQYINAMSRKSVRHDSKGNFDYNFFLAILENVTAWPSEDEFYTGGLILYCATSLSRLRLRIAR